MRTDVAAMTPIERLTAAQSLVAALLRDFIDCPEPDCGDHDLPIAKAIPFTADLAAVLAVVEAAQMFNGIANETMTVADKTWPERYDVARHALRAALAAIEGSKP